MRGDPKLYQILNELNISYDYYEHPPVPTVKEAAKYWKNIEATHCKNLFLRNHKGNRHYLVDFEYTHTIAIHDLEQRLKQGKLTFASEKRLMENLGLTPGSVTPFGLINDKNHHVHVFLDENLQKVQKISFHPCINTASIVITFSDFIRFMDWMGNSYEFVKLYD